VAETYRTFEEITEFVCEHIPSEWEFSLRMTTGCLDIAMHRPCGEPIIRDYPSEMPVQEQIRDLVNHARQADGLTAVCWDGSQDFGDDD